MLGKKINLGINSYILFFFTLIAYFYLNQASSVQKITDNDDVIQLRQLAMQGMWIRVKRLAPYVEAESPLEYGPKEAIKDASELVLLLNKVERLWPKESNMSYFGFTNANPSVWAVPKYFDRLYTEAENAAKGLEVSLKEGDDNSAVNFMCQLGQSCGSCHASFRRLLTSQLANEASDWSGGYIKECN